MNSNRYIPHVVKDCTDSRLRLAALSVLKNPESTQDEIRIAIKSCLEYRNRTQTTTQQTSNLKRAEQQAALHRARTHIPHVVKQCENEETRDQAISVLRDPQTSEEEKRIATRNCLETQTRIEEHRQFSKNVRFEQHVEKYIRKTAHYFGDLAGERIS